ncbi:four-carbon acid sugar kinase family protein [Kaustia mangrovi]|uniref:Four-carbon acid sugar kinase family protein n=1 Tax=Kaustia mangrovi TaxID=2593653 RepID=A0A7S8C3S7_9HYPH|nr:four-carbon acid sugar kinase family protein [Kaustia mangrovi]QPC42816.1 four-carbon acid sugar kinase family protein [Kaustia mangrovi]
MTVARETLAQGCLLAFHGDDFTGSTDAMEVFAFNGLPAVLFLEPPTPERLSAFAGYRAIGIAGTARSRTPGWMERHLPEIFATLAGLGAPILHYKVCSTFDSSPTVGSIGKALELGLRARPCRWSPMIVAAPRLGRYQAFGNLFATVDGEGYRLDRHPTMARHPVTPMGEADLSRHLADQTDLPIGLVDFVALKEGRGADRLETVLADGARAVLVDVMDEETLAAAGALVWQGRGDGLFSASSSGLQYALIAHWRRAGLLPQATARAGLGPVDRIAAVSGSCSPVTADQIGWSFKNGFADIAPDATRLADPATRQEEIADTVSCALAALEDGRSPLVHTARGPDDPRIVRFADKVRALGIDPAEGQDRIGRALGDILSRVVRQAGLGRVVVSGGDTAGRAGGALGLYALEAMVPVAPGAPLCLAHAKERRLEGLQIAFKGGQIGGPDYFGRVRAGGGT